MGILGKDLFDIGQPRTHVKVQFGQSACWVEHFVVGEARTAFEAYIFSEEQKDAAYMREQADAVHFIQERYAWFLTEAFQRRAFEKKKGQRKLPLAQQIYENCVDAFVSGVSLGQSPKVDAPQVNIQYAVLEIDEGRHDKGRFSGVGDAVRTAPGRGPLSAYERARTQDEKAAIAERLRGELNQL